MNRTYNDLLYLEHPVSKKHPRMSARNRAAQFSPFAALTGFENVLDETTRPTVSKKELDESWEQLLNERLLWITEHRSEEPLLTFTCFEPDERKEGGSYQTVTGIVRKVSSFERTVLLKDGRVISLDSIIAIDGNCFH